MSICRGVAGNRGRNPVGIFFHNDAGSKNANAAFYRNWLQTHPLENGFAHYYVAQDGILQAEDDWNCAWHCGDTNGNLNYLGIETCQSMGDLDVFKANEEKALQLAAQKCKQYGITPSTSTIRLHQEVYATSCPHRSVEIHGGREATKSYFIKRIKEYMAGNVTPPTYVSGGQ
ncbi:MAG: N-acetylmuramoyl-L-alanine amidase, partial [Lachnospiraceae bacterium]|nr:N-acetylmuramoyl-L-alanine amidase [Lachnospiraceae bacterium]